MSGLRLIVNGTPCVVPVDDARELAARVRVLLDSPERPLLAAAIFIESCCERALTADVPLKDQEEADLGWALDMWAVEVGHDALPASMRAVREALRTRAA